MILLVGSLGDRLLAHVCGRLLERDARFVLLEPSNFPARADVTWTVAGARVEGQLRVGERAVSLGEVRAVYTRAGSRPTARDGGAAARRAAEGERLLDALADVLPALVVNRPSASRASASKPYQARRIAHHGLPVPRTLVTTEPEEARAFFEACGRRVVYKSVSGARSIVRRMTPDDLARLDRVRACPTQFQQWIAGTDVRVHVVGRRVFATEVIADAADHRYAGRDAEPRRMRGVDLPADVAARCVALASELGLVVAGIDLRRSPAGEYYCLDANPSPAFDFYEARSGQRIGDAVVDLLERGAP